jgi:hypothetical protein
MKSYILNIADYIIKLESSENGPEMIPSQRFLGNICSKENYDILINVRYGEGKMPEKAERVFHAPFVEEINGIPIRHKTNFWSIWKYDEDLYIKSVFPLCPDERKALLKFSLDSREWDLNIDCKVKELDPLEYPLDGLVLYYLTVIHSDILIHASGVTYNNTGYLFSGVSGRGKSTMARIWDEYGAKVIHDDRLIIRKQADGYFMYNTPVYANDTPSKASLDKLFLIDHGASNDIVTIKGAVATSLVMANCIQHNWGREIITRLLGSVTSMCEAVPVMKLSFVPDKSVADYILKYG